MRFIRKIQNPMNRTNGSSQINDAHQGVLPRPSTVSGTLAVSSWATSVSANSSG